MPTPFMHLWLNEELRSQALSGSDEDRELLGQIANSWPAFYLGSVAPDYQTICGVPRAETHFYTMPPDSVSQGWRNLLATYPDLYPGRKLDADQAAFIAAYLMHLYLDLDWHFNIVMPYFADMSIVGDLRHAYLLHVILLTYLDRRAFELLPETAAADLSAAHYDQWLPFATNDQIDAWQEFLLRQMAPEAAIQTVEIFAGRLQMPPDEFSAKLNDPGWMDVEFFSRIPVAEIERQLFESLPACLDLVMAYYDGRLADYDDHPADIGGR